MSIIHHLGPTNGCIRYDTLSYEVSSCVKKRYNERRRKLLLTIMKVQVGGLFDVKIQVSGVFDLTTIDNNRLNRK